MREVDNIEAVENKRVELDKSGFFVILVDDQITVEHYHNVMKEGTLEVETGRLNKVITGKDAKAICETIIREELVSQLDHAAYLGRELEKAELALKHGLDYEQCEPLSLEK